jgi:23S rRNA pseudouridine2605 synthase
MRLQKLLASHGRGSRREIEQLIEAGRVTINGVAARLGDRASATDRIGIDGAPIRLAREAADDQVLLYHKPAGEIVSRDDPEHRPSVFDHLPTVAEGRWISVGRLDFNSSGLLLLTTSGELAARLMHPRHEIEREYAVRVLGLLSAEQRARLLEGIPVPGAVAQFAQIEDGGGEGTNHWYSVKLQEGRNREVRRLFEAVGLTVSRLIRVSYGPIRLPKDLPRGRYRLASAVETTALKRAVGLEEAAQAAIISRL